MIIGIALSKHSRLEIDLKLMAGTFIPKFILWPAFGFGIIFIDLTFFGAFGPEVHQMLAVICAVPMAGNLVAYAATLNLHPERAASAVLVSTLIAFLTVPGAVLLYQLISG